MTGAAGYSRAVPDQLPWQRELCAPFLERLPISGMSISVFGAGRRESTICATDATAVRIDELQFSLGEGPHWEAMRTGLPVTVDDVGNDTHRGWPVFGRAVTSLDVGALFALPLAIGAVVVGIADLYRVTPGRLNAADFVAAQALASSAADPAVLGAVRTADEDSSEPAGIAPETRREVQQATGIMLVQMDVTATEALFELKAYSFLTGQTVEAVARQVVTRQLNFRDYGASSGRKG